VCKGRSEEEEEAREGGPLRVNQLVVNQPNQPNQPSQPSQSIHPSISQLNPINRQINNQK